MTISLVGISLTGKSLDLSPVLLRPKASFSVRAQSVTFMPLLARTMPGIIPQEVVPTIETLGVN